jgi:sialidase-1
MKRLFIPLMALFILVSTVGISPVFGAGAESVSDSRSMSQLSQTSGQVIGKPDITISTTKEEFGPGTTSQFQLALTNRGEIRRAGPSKYQQRVTTARGVNVNIKDDNTPFDLSTGTVAIGNVPTGTTQTGPISITVPTTIEPGSYTIPVEYEYDYTRIVSYDSTGAEYSDFTETSSGSITIRVRNRAQFAVVE